MGAVYLAVDEALVSEVTLKMIAPELAGSSHGLERLRDEVRLAQKVTHPTPQLPASVPSGCGV